MRTEWKVSEGGQTRSRVRGVVGCLSMLAAPILLAQLAVAQQQTVPPSEPNAPAVVQPRPEPRGFFEAFGRWFEEGTAGFRSHVAGAKTSMDEFNQRAEETRKSIGDSATEMSKNAVGAGVAAAALPARVEAGVGPSLGPKTPGATTASRAN